MTAAHARIGQTIPMGQIVPMRQSPTFDLRPRGRSVSEAIRAVAMERKSA